MSGSNAACNLVNQRPNKYYIILYTILYYIIYNIILYYIQYYIILYTILYYYYIQYYIIINIILIQCINTRAFYLYNLLIAEAIT